MEIVGQAPELAGLQCNALICEGFVHNGRPVANANVVYLCFAHEWHKLVIDCGVIIWRPWEGQPTPGRIESMGWEYPHVDIGTVAGIVGHRLEFYKMATAPAAGRVIFVFDNGRKITINNENDRSAYQIG
jgi:hypothetical protein